MKILMVMAGGEKGGAELMFEDAALTFHMDEGIEVHAVIHPFPDRLERLRRAGIPVKGVNMKGWLGKHVTARRALRQIIQQVRPDIVYAWMGRAAMLLPPPEWSRKHGAVNTARLGGYYNMRHFRNAEYFVAIAPGIRQHITEHGNIEPGRIRLIENYVDFGTEPEAPPPLPPRRDGVHLLLSLGRLHKNKGYDVFLDALADLPDCDAWIVGEGPERPALEHRARELGLEGCVHMPGWRDDRLNLFRQADLFIHPSREEGFGSVFIQAWATRTPYIGAASEGPASYVRDKIDGRIVPVEDKTALRDAIRETLDFPERAAQYAENGFARYQEHFTRERFVAAHKDWFETAMGAKPGTGKRKILTLM